MRTKKNFPNFSIRSHSKGIYFDWRLEVIINQLSTDNWIWTSGVNCSISLILQWGQTSFSSFHLRICVATKVNILSIKYNLFLTYYLQVIWAGEVKLDCWVSLKYQDEENKGLSKWILSLCIYVRITISVINTLHILVVFNMIWTAYVKFSSNFINFW